MPGLIHRSVVGLLRVFPLPDPMGLGLEKNIVIRQDPTDKQIKKHHISLSEFQGHKVYNFGALKNGEPILYYCHGGGFITGLFRQYYDAIGRLQKAVRAPITCLDYPMPPETDAQGLLDANIAYFRQIRQDFPDSPIIISGDSAGGHMTLTLAQTLTPKERETISAIFPLFPVTDMSREPGSVIFHKEEVLLHEENMPGIRDRFIGAFSKRDPIISPLYGDLSGLPDTHVYSGSKDPLYQDSLDLEAGLTKSGQIHSHHVFEGYGQN